MPKYLVLLIGTGEGCDYTIGCNQAFEELECTKEQLGKEIIRLYEEYGDERIESHRVFEINEINVDLTKYKQYLALKEELGV